MTKQDNARAMLSTKMLYTPLGWLLVFAVLVGCGGQQVRTGSSGTGLETTRIRVGLAVPGATYLPVYLASDAGTYAREGLQVDVIEFRGGSDLIKAVVSGS